MDSDGDDEKGPIRMYRRHQGFWGPLNSWYRSVWEAEGRRPQTAELKTWYEEFANTYWGDSKPTWEEAKAHSKCLRSLDQVRSYFRSYRAAKRISADGDGPDTSQSCGGGSTVAFERASSLSIPPAQQDGLRNDVPVQRAAKVRRPSADSATSDGNPSTSAGIAPTASTATLGSKASSWTLQAEGGGTDRVASASDAHGSSLLALGPSGADLRKPRESTGSGPAPAGAIGGPRPAVSLVFGEDPAGRSAPILLERGLSDTDPMPVPVSATNLKSTWVPSPTDFSRSAPASRQPSPTDPYRHALPPLPHPPPAPHLPPLASPLLANQQLLQPPFCRPHGHHPPGPQLSFPIDAMPSWPQPWERPPLPPAQHSLASGPSGSGLRSYSSAPVTQMSAAPFPQAHHVQRLRQLGTLGHAESGAVAAAVAAATASASKAAGPSGSAAAGPPKPPPPPPQSVSKPGVQPVRPDAQAGPTGGDGHPTAPRSQAPGSLCQQQQQPQASATSDCTQPLPIDQTKPPSAPPPPSAAASAGPMHPHYPTAPYPTMPYGLYLPSMHGYAAYADPYAYPYGLPDPSLGCWGMYPYYYPPHQNPPHMCYPDKPHGCHDPRHALSTVGLAAAPAASSLQCPRPHQGPTGSAPSVPRAPSRSYTTTGCATSTAVHQTSSASIGPAVTDTAATRGAASTRPAQPAASAKPPAQPGRPALNRDPALPTSTSTGDLSLLVESFFNHDDEDSDNQAGLVGAPADRQHPQRQQPAEQQQDARASQLFTAGGALSRAAQRQKPTEPAPAAAPAANEECRNTAPGPDLSSGATLHAPDSTCDMTVLVTARRGAGGPADAKPHAQPGPYAMPSPFAHAMSSCPLGTDMEFGLDLGTDIGSPGGWVAAELSPLRMQRHGQPHAAAWAPPTATDCEVGSWRAGAQCATGTAGATGLAASLGGDAVCLAALPLPDLEVLDADFDLDCALLFASPGGGA